MPSLMLSLDASLAQDEMSATLSDGKVGQGITKKALVEADT
jgi:hypothetical protein